MAAFRREQKDAGKVEKKDKEWNALAKKKWDKMSDKQKSAYAVEVSEEEKKKREDKRKTKNTMKGAKKVAKEMTAREIIDERSMTLTYNPGETFIDN